MGSYEQDVKKRIEEGSPLPEKLDISLVKYFWQANPFIGTKADNIPKFLRSIKVLKNFTDNELRILSRYMHHRVFSDGEKVFRQSDLGFGLYFIYSGRVDVIVESNYDKDPSEKEDNQAAHILSLEKFDYFGELALLQDKSIRSATVVAQESCELLGVFKPDVEDLISNYPIVATKLLQSVSVIIANRLFSITKEVRRLKFKVKQLEEEKARNA